MAGSHPTPRSTRTPAASAFTQVHARTVLAPLREKEAAAAVKLALEAVLRDERIRRDRLRRYGPHLRIEKSNEPDGPPIRMIWVRLRDRDQGLVHEVSVAGKAVVEHRQDPNAHPAYNDEEYAEARALIAADERLGPILKRQDTEIEWFSPHVHGPGRLIGARLVRVEGFEVVAVLAQAEVELDQGVMHTGR